MRTARRLLVLAMLPLALVTGCSTDIAQTGVARPSDARSYVPDDVRRAGVLVVGADLSYEPMEYLENGKPTGVDYDIAVAIGARLGVRVEFRQTDWDNLIPDVSAHKVDIAMSAITDTLERQKTVDFVDYLNVGIAIVSREDAPAITGVGDLCGRRVAVSEGEIFADVVTAAARLCPRTKPLRRLRSDNPTADVKASRADIYLDDYPVAVVQAEASPVLRVFGEQIETAPYGMAIAKNRKDLTRAVQMALLELCRDGSYDKLLTKWKLTEGALRTGTINGGA